MTCERCGGLVIAASFTGGDDALTAWEYHGWKCMNCGHVTDPQFAKNRAAQTGSRTPYPAGRHRVPESGAPVRRAA